MPANQHRQDRKRTLVVIAVSVCLLSVLMIVVVGNLRTDDSIQKDGSQTEQSAEMNTKERYTVTAIGNMAQAKQYAADHSEANLPGVNYEESSTLSVEYSAPSPGYSLTAVMSDERVNIVLNTPGEKCYNPQVVTKIYASVVVDKKNVSTNIGDITEQQGAPCPG